MVILGMTQKVGISNNAKDFVITQKLIKEAEHIVFPFVSFPLQPIIDDIRAVKPAMRFSYYIDANYYLMPDSYPYAKEYKVSKMIDMIEANIKAVDQVIVTNKALKDYIAEKLKERHPGVVFNTNIVWQPLFILPELMKTPYENITTPGKIKVLIIGDDYHFSDINFIKGILKDFKVKYKDTGELHIIGFNGVRGDKNYLQGLDFIYHERVPYFRYFELIKHIAPDVLLIPANKNTFNNTSKNYVKYLEMAYMNTPVIAPGIKPYSDLITTNKNGFLCNEKEDYFMQLEAMFNFREKFEDVLGHAYATTVDYNIAGENNIEILKKIYFTDDGNDKPTT
jgi:glycosyltransferase involved in cell wall biosynthesis